MKPLLIWHHLSPICLSAPHPICLLAPHLSFRHPICLFGTPFYNPPPIGQPKWTSSKKVKIVLWRAESCRLRKVALPISFSCQMEPVWMVLSPMALQNICGLSNPNYPQHLGSLNNYQCTPPSTIMPGLVLE